MITTSPSALHRELKCIASALLPTSGSEGGPAAVRGDTIHAFMALRAEKGHDVARATLPPELQEFVDQIEFEKLPLLDVTTGVAELAMAWNPKTGKVRELARGGKLTREQIRALAEPGEMVGIVDYLMLTDAAVVIFDWKTGWTPVEAAATNVQLGAYAFMAAKLFGRDEADVAIARLLEGMTHTDQAHLDELDLGAIESRVRQHVQRVELLRKAGNVVPAPFEGDHCRYCPAMAFCPAKTALALSVLSDGKTPAALLASMPAALQSEDVARLWPKVTAAIDLLEALRGKLKEHARARPVTLSNGMVLAAVEHSREKLVADQAEDVLDPGVFAEAVEVKRSMTKKALKEALQKRLQPGQKISHVEKDTLEKLRAAGAVKVEAWTDVEEVKPAKVQLPAGDYAEFEEHAS